MSWFERAVAPWPFAPQLDAATVARNRGAPAARRSAAARKAPRILAGGELYWHDAERPTPKERARLLTEATAALRNTMEKLHAEGSPTSTTINRELSKSSIALTWHTETVQRLTANDDSSPFGGAHFHRHEFLAAALDLWVTCGGVVAFSRSPKKPGGPLIRYLECVCKIVMGSHAPAAETLAKFLSEWKSD